MTLFPPYTFADGERDVRQTDSSKEFRSQLSHNIFADYVSNTDPDVQARQLSQSREDFSGEYYDDLGSYMNNFGPSQDVSVDELKTRAKVYLEDVSAAYCASIPEHISELPSVQDPMPTFTTATNTSITVAFEAVVKAGECGVPPQMELRAQSNGSTVIDAAFQGSTVPGAFIFTPSNGFSGEGSFGFKITNAKSDEVSYGIVYIQIG